MNRAFESKDGKVLVVENASTSRQLITEVLRSQGFANIQSVATCKDALQLLEVESVDWVLAPLDSDQEVTGLHLLQVGTISPSLRHTRFSIFVDEDKADTMPAIFEFGGICTFRRPFTKESFTKELASFIAECEWYRFNLSLVAASYLRRFLSARQSFGELLRMEKALLETFPYETGLLLHLAEAQFLAGQKEKAFSTLRLSKALDPAEDGKVKALLARHAEFGEFAASQGNALDTNLLGIDHAVIVDTDDQVVANIKNLLAEQGVGKVQHFSDGPSAFEYIVANKSSIGVIIQEWRIPKLTGPLLLQRIRHEVGLSIPIVVVSSLLRSEDFPLVREMSVSDVVEKPIEKPGLLKKLISVLHQERMPTDQLAMERKLRDALQRGNQAEARELHRKYCAEPFPEARKLLLEAEILYASKALDQAREIGFKSLKVGGDSLATLNLLGRVLMHLRDFDTALRCFEKAQKLSPQNLERICSMAEAHAELGDHEAANAQLEAAKTADSGAAIVRETETKKAIITGDTSAAKALMQQMQSIDEIIAFMNNKAVSLAKCGLLDESIEQYRRALHSLPDNRTDYLASVEYNLALAYARNSQLEEAKIHVDKCAKVDIARIRNKALALKKRLDRALMTGEPFNLNESQNASTAAPSTGSNVGGGYSEAASARSQSSASSSDSPSTGLQSVLEIEIRGAVDISRGEIGCFMLYTPSEPYSAATKKMFSNPPRFTPREAISRGEAMGVEATMKRTA